MDSYFSVHLPRINDPAPDFRATTTHGERKLSDYKGKWLILFSHPADFTPVCTTELVAFAKSHDRFQAMECELLGLSIDSTFAHLAWIRKAVSDQIGLSRGAAVCSFRRCAIPSDISTARPR
jgi:peroxiredoxin (alkyl hydroperoxide reductase subunit C)